MDEEDERIPCPNCGNWIGEDDEECQFCGEKLQEEKEGEDG